VTVSDQEQRDFYEKNKTRYQMPEQRKAKYVFVDTVKYHREATATDQELHDYFNQHVEDYRLKELVSAQHILFKTEGKKPEEVDAIRKKALRAGSSQERRGLQYTRKTVFRRFNCRHRWKSWRVSPRPDGG
jgi:peptidyl-prolyl cis-trans isomerase D